MRLLYKLALGLSKVMILFLLASFAQAIIVEADDCEFIRIALNDPNVHEVVIPEGSYTANRPIVVNRSGVSLIGKGRVTITLADNANSPLLILGNIETPPAPISDLRVDNLILKGNRDNQSMECWGGPCDSDAFSTIRNNGVTIRGVHRANITNIQTIGMRSGGIVTEKVCSELNIDGWISKDNYFDGFAGYETTNSTFKNLDLSENMGAGISIDIRFHGNTFKNVRMHKNMDVGIFMRDSNNNYFIDLKSYDSGNHAIFLSQVDSDADTVPINNTFENLEVDGAKGDGFHLNDPGVGNRLINAKFRNVRGRNIFETLAGIIEILPATSRCELLFR